MICKPHFSGDIKNSAIITLLFLNYHGKCGKNAVFMLYFLMVCILKTGYIRFTYSSIFQKGDRE